MIGRPLGNGYRTPAVRLLLDILQGIGVSGAAGVRPFLPALLTGGLAGADAGVDFDGTAFDFLEQPWFLIVIAVAAAATIALERREGADRLEAGPLGAALSGIAIGLGALLFAGILDDRHDTWWYGLPLGIACATVGTAAARSLFGRVRTRLDPDAQAALPVYAEAAALLAAGLSILFPPLGIVVLAFLIWLYLGGRRRAGEKYAGLRILRG
jgi:hypothetical protein